MKGTTLDNLHYIRLAHMLAGRKEFRLENGMLLSPYVLGAYPYKVEVGDTGLWIENTLTAQELKVGYCLREYEVHADYVADVGTGVEKFWGVKTGMHVAPFPIHEQDWVSAYMLRECVVACFCPEDILFFDGTDVSVGRLFIPSPETLHTQISLLAEQYSNRELYETVEQQLHAILTESEIYREYDTIVEAYRR